VNDGAALVHALLPGSCARAWRPLACTLSQKKKEEEEEEEEEERERVRDSLKKKKKIFFP
jgi:hypothetical protein